MAREKHNDKLFYTGNLLKVVKTSHKFSDDKTIIDDINLVSEQIKILMTDSNDSKVSDDDVRIIENNVYEILYFWTECTYLGQEKSIKLSAAFNIFYTILLKYLISLRNVYPDSDLVHALYQGKIYRVLGSSNPIENHKKIIPRYNNCFVSWSKNANIPTPYMETKLYGPLTRLEAEITGDMYGIDLTVFGVSKNDEEEIVFPSIKKTILNIEYITD